MNLFFLHTNPVEAAKMHCDKHVVKMIVETAQILSTAHWMTGSAAPYKKHSPNNPIMKWARSSLANYRWAANLGLNLCEEYTLRYNKTHKTEQHIKWLKEHEPSIPDVGLTPVHQSMPEQYKAGDPVEAYRRYYIFDKRRFAKWTNRPIPEWFLEGVRKVEEESSKRNMNTHTEEEDGTDETTTTTTSIARKAAATISRRKRIRSTSEEESTQQRATTSNNEVPGSSDNGTITTTTTTLEAWNRATRRRRRIIKQTQA